MSKPSLTILLMQYFDGGSRGNPGPAGCGTAVFDPSDKCTPVATASAYLGRATNNAAEYEGLILGLQLALRNGARHVIIRGDSMLVVRQIRGEWRAHNDHLRDLLEIVREKLLPRFDSWEVGHVYRDKNSEADALANEAMDGGRGGQRPRLPSEECR
jgi:ribonuclease HI